MSAGVAAADTVAAHTPQTDSPVRVVSGSGGGSVPPSTAYLSRPMDS